MNYNNLKQMSMFQSFCQEVLDLAYDKISTKVLMSNPPILIIDTLSAADREIARLNAYIYLEIKLNSIANLVDPLSLDGMASIIHSIAHEVSHSNQEIDYIRYTKDFQYYHSLESNADYQANNFISGNIVLLSDIISKYTIYPYSLEQIVGTLLNIYTSGISMRYGLMIANINLVNARALYHFIFCTNLSDKNVEIISNALIDTNIPNIDVYLSARSLKDVLKEDADGYITMESAIDLIEDDSTELISIKEDGIIFTLDDPDVAYLCRCLSDVHCTNNESHKQSLVLGPTKSGTIIVLISRDQLHLDGQRTQGFITKGE